MILFKSTFQYYSINIYNITLVSNRYLFIIILIDEILCLMRLFS